MKRDREVPHNLLLLPPEIWFSIIPEAFPYCSQLTTVSKEWKEVIDTQRDWLERAKLLYSLPDRPESTELIFRTRFKWYSEWEKLEEGVEKSQYNNYGGPGDNEREAVMFQRVEKRPLLTRFPQEKSRILSEVRALLYYLEHFIKEEPFKNFISRLLVAKYRQFTSDQSLLPALLTLSLCQYVERESSSRLVRRNFHWRDVNISFVEEDHRYTLYSIWCPERSRSVSIRSHRVLDDNETLNSFRSLSHNEDDLRKDVHFCDLRSVTTFIGSLFPEFNEDEVLAGMRNKKMSDDEYKKLWASIREEASREGTRMHLNLENYVLGREHYEEGREWEHFKVFERAILLGRWIPYRTEWMLWCQELMLCGSADIIYQEAVKRNIVGRDFNKIYLKIGDYKRCKEIRQFNSYQSGIPECEAVAHLGDCNYFHFMIQLPLYKYMLEKYYNVVVLGMFIIVLHPNQETYIKMDLNPRPGFIESIIDYRRKQLERMRAERQTLI